ncbi:MAG: DinB family protein [Chitinophagales bacterium]|mgnify:CR=1 FL=1|nr:DinB family protein [Chitinophagales bacterium]
MTKPELITVLTTELKALQTTLQQTTNEAFFKKPDHKWSVAENVQHLHLSARPLNLAFSLPKIILRFFGSAYRKSYPYDEIVKRYQQLLKDGAVATGAYVPRGIPVKGDKEKIIARFSNTHETLMSKVQSLREEDLDNYFLPHPLLGKITIREMLYFTIYHISHHHKIVKERA